MTTRPLAVPFRRVVRLALTLAALVSAFGTAAARAQGTDGYTLEPVSATTQTVRPGPLTLEARVRSPFGTPSGDFLVRWRVVATTAGATGGGQQYSASDGITRASFRIPRSGRTTIEADLFGQIVLFEIRTSQSTGTPAPTPVPDTLVLEPAGATALELTLGERGTVAIRLTFSDGRPAPGFDVRFAVESSPGSPGVGRSDQTVTTGADGVAAATFGFSTAGRTTIRASLPNARIQPEPPSILFTVDTASLGTLDPSRQSYLSIGEALDAICLDVFVEGGQQRPQPQPTPLCVYMTGTLDEESERADAMRAFSPTGIGSLGTSSLAGLEQQRGSIQSRLAALRGGALRGAVDQIALDLGGTRLSSEMIAAASADRHSLERFAGRLESSFARLYAGLDAEDAPATATAPEIAALRDRPWGFFVTGRLSQGERDETGEETGFDFDTVGLTVGVDRAVGANGFVGLALSSLGGETELTGDGGELDTDALAATLYLIREGEKGYLQGTLSAGRDEFAQRRNLDLPEIGRLVARADFEGDQLGATLELGRSVDGRAGSLTFFARGNWARAEIDGFREEGAEATIPGTGFGVVDFGLEVEAQTVESLLGEAGVDWGRAISTGSGLIIPQLTATWAHEFDDDPQAVAARFLADASGATFQVFTDEPDRDWLTLSGALRFQFLWGSLFVAYDHDLLRDDFEMRTVNAGLRFEF
jgi:uncharacterized protein YhjY with autotransporter beta-barrel domain